MLKVKRYRFQLNLGGVSGSSDQPAVSGYSFNSPGKGTFTLNDGNGNGKIIFRRECSHWGGVSGNGNDIIGKWV